MMSALLRRPASTNNVLIPAYTLNVALKLSAVPITITKQDATVPMAIVEILLYAVNVPSVLEMMSVPLIWPVATNTAKILAIAA